MKFKRNCRFTPDERMRIVKEYESCVLSASEVGEKYGISGSLLSKWRQRLSMSSESSKFGVESSIRETTDIDMKDKSREELEAEVKRLRKELEWSKLQTKALNTMIEIAEEQGIQIRKKSGAKR